MNPMWNANQYTVHTVIYIDSETKPETNTNIHLYDGNVNPLYCIGK